MMGRRCNRKQTIKQNKSMANGNLEANKESLLQDLEQRVNDHILEPQNAALLKKLILKADSPEEALQIASLGTTYKRTGFNFDKRLERMGQDIHYFKKNQALSFATDPTRPTHKLIIGDNYPALQNLLIEYRGRVSVIYIDPPYGKDSMGEFARTNYENALSRDNLLSMLYPRLWLAKQLLADDGVIFCSIDDRNQAYVKGLFDEVFGEKNFVECFIWNKTSTPPALSYKSRRTHEFILCYTNIPNNDKFVGLTNNGGDAPLLNESNKEATLSFPANYVRTNLKDGVYKAGKRERVELLNDIRVESGVIANEFQLQGKFRWQQSTLDQEVESNCLLIVKSDSFAIRYCREGNRSVAPPNYITERFYENDTTIDKAKQNVDTNEKAGKELESILGKKVFDFPKPTSLVSYLLSFNGNKQSIVLDFFAGSGTTGQAVLALNEKDGGTRKFILCQLNEKTDTTPNGIAYDVTTKRLKRVMTGTCYDGSRDFRWAEENQPYGDNLDVYEMETVSNNNAIEGKTPFDVIDETLYGQKRFATFRKKVEWVCANFAHTQKTEEDDEAWEKRQKEEDHVTEL